MESSDLVPDLLILLTTAAKKTYKVKNPVKENYQKYKKKDRKEKKKNPNSISKHPALHFQATYDPPQKKN